MLSSILLGLLAAAASTHAKTDLEGCTSTDVSSPAGASIAWYVPGTGEICAFLDCGGGRAPPKTTVPGCAQYSGTETYSASFLPGYNAQATSAPATTAAATTTAASDLATSAAEGSPSTSVDWSALETDTAVSSWDLYTNTGLTSAAAPTEASSASGATSTVDSTGSVTAAVTQGGSTQAPATTSGAAVPVAGTGAAGNGTAGNGTLSNASPSGLTSIAAAAETARALAGGVGIVVALGALVVAL